MIFYSSNLAWGIFLKKNLPPLVRSFYTNVKGMLKGDVAIHFITWYLKLI